ncbi:hypothetical protein [Ochrobactrum sp. Marseille-Q0166]|uniref:hypothetical protein n=1 Tax=Ochrobactrum sp. Marseille-Q0166 TaxID=2761105 RepID=UPI0016563F30|nr:hypothetical protein [Ochrobactrum sp. Marseille-Q0166]MBC8718201.1 hypothetical protein [Ochrobactrum sp. Marseille-Q0166]
MRLAGQSATLSPHALLPTMKEAVEQVHQDKTSPVNIPNTPPSERARECEKETRKAIEEAYWKLVYGWPGLAGQPQEKWLKAWFALTPEERIEAAAKRDAWIDLLKSNGHHKVHRPGTYFEGKLWKQVPDQSAEAGRKPTRIEARPFSNPFMVEVYRNLLLVEPVAPSPITKIEALLVEQGRRTEAEIQWDKRRENGWPAVNDMFERARGWRSSVVSASLTAVFPFLVPVLVGGEMWDAWKAFHQEQGWQRFPPTGKLQYVHFPAGGPDGLKDFEAALRGLGENDGN